jgi:hypothetical protein
MGNLLVEDIALVLDLEGSRGTTMMERKMVDRAKVILEGR